MDSCKKQAGNYLSIDGGPSGLSGLSALYILEEIFERIKWDLNLTKVPLPCEWFDLIVGTGTGAVDALLLGKLRLSPSQAIETYMKLKPVLSIGPAKNEEERKENTEILEKALADILGDTGLDAKTLMQPMNQSMLEGKVFVCTLNTANLAVLHPIRSYPIRGSAALPCTILQAACASIAFVDRFIPVTVVSGHRKIILIDAMAGYANPTKALLQEAERIFGSDAEVSSIISIGSGKGDIITLSTQDGHNSLNNASQLVALECEQTHKELLGRLQRSSIYFRFNVEGITGNQLDAPSIHGHTSAYLQESTTYNLLNDAVERIKNRESGLILRELNSIATKQSAPKPRPPLVQNFVGREDVLESMRKMHFRSSFPRQGMPAITILSGLGGSGKTQTALKFALEFESKYLDALIYFVDASSEDKLKMDFDQIFRSKGTNLRAKSYGEALIWLASQKSRWLLILDNADDESFDVSQPIPECPHGSVIITTRNFMYSALAPAGSHHLEGLLPFDAVELILKASNYENDPENQEFARKIANMLGYLPLALAHAAGYILVHRCLASYPEIYLKSRPKFLASTRTLLHSYRASIATTIQMSLDRLPKQALHIIMLFSRLQTTSIAHGIISKAATRQFRYTYTSFKTDLDPQTIEDIDTLMDIFCPSGDWIEADFNDLIDQCFRYSLIQLIMDSNVKFYSMHVLVQAYLQSSTHSLDKPEQLVARLLASSITIGKPYEYFAFNRLLVPHLRLVDVNSLVEPEDHHLVGTVLYEQGSSALSAAHFERCLTLLRSVLGEEDHETMTAMFDLASSYTDLGMHEDALGLKERVLEMRKRTLGEEHPDTLFAMGSLAVSYGTMGWYQDAIELQERVLTMRKQLLGNEHLDSVRAMGSLALLYGEMGRHKEALSLKEKVLEIFKQLSGEEHPETARAMSSLGATYEELGRLQEALNLKQRAVEIQKQVSGDEHPETLWTMASLAVAYDRLGRKGNAMDLKERVLTLQRQLLGEKHPETIRAMGSLAVSYSEMGEHHKALHLQEQVLDMRKNSSGMQHPETANAMANLARSYSGLGRYQEAIGLEEEVLDIRTRSLGEEHPKVVDAMENLAASYSAVGKRFDALELEEKVVSMRKKLLGEEHPQTIGAMANLAVSYEEAGRYSDAIEHRKHILDLQRTKAGDRHQDTIRAMADLAATYGSLGRYREACVLEKQVLMLLRHSMGVEHPDTVHAMANLAVSYSEMGRHQDALELELQVLRIRENRLGSDHPDTINGMANLAASYGEMGRHQEALRLEEKVLKLRKRSLGEEHADTLNAMSNLAVSYDETGRHWDAFKLRERALEMQQSLLGEDHPQTIGAMANLAVSYDVMGYYQDALKLKEKVLEMQRLLLGEEHPDTMHAMSNLAVSYGEVGRKQDALTLEEQVLKTCQQVLGEEHPSTLLAMWNLSFTLGELGLLERRISLVQSALPIYEKVLGKDHADTQELKECLRQMNSVFTS